MREPRLGVRGVEVRSPNPSSRRGTQHDREPDAASVVIAGERGGDLIEPRSHEVGVLELRDGAQSLHGRPDRRPHDGLLGDRCVHDPIGAETLDEPFRHLERAPVSTDVLTQEVDALVALHLLPERLGDRDQVGRQAVFAPLAARFRTVACSAGFHLLGSHHSVPVPPPRPASVDQ